MQQERHFAQTAHAQVVPSQKPPRYTVSAQGMIFVMQVVAGIVAVAGLLTLLLITMDFLHGRPWETFGHIGQWFGDVGRALLPFVIVGVVIGALALGWRVYRVVHKHVLDVRAQGEIIAQNQAARLAIHDARTQGHAMKLTFGDTGVLASVEISPAMVSLPKITAGKTTVEPVATQKPLEIAPPRSLVAPKEYDLLNVFKRFEVDRDNIFLGVAADGDWLSVDSHKQLCHGAFNAVTGRGKTVVERGIEMQLIKAGCEIIHADIKFALIDESGLDYRPIARALVEQGDIKAPDGVSFPHLLLNVEHIKNMLAWLAGPEIDRRLNRFHHGVHDYSTLYVFLEELAFLIKKVPEVATYIETIIVVGRSLGIKVFTAAQNFQVQNIGVNGGMRENFESAWFLGGDTKSGASMLDMTEKDLKVLLAENNIALGRGVAMLRNNTVAYEARLMRAGMASNNSLYYLLGRADNFVLPAYIAGPAIESESPSFGGMGTRRGLGGTSYVEHELANASYVPPDERREINHQFIAVEGQRISRTGPLLNRPDLPLKPVPPSPDDGPNLGPDDRRFTTEQEQEFLRRYRKTPNIKECLRQMNSGEGLTNRYSKHASWLLKQDGLI